MPRNSKVIFVIILLQLIAFSYALAAEYQLVPGVIHLDSKVSGGDHSIERLVQIAEAYGQEVVIITDHDKHEATYGIWPLQNILKKTIKHGSIETYGARRYISDIKEAQKAHPDVVVIHGAETIPFYYWEGSLGEKNLRLKNFHKHLLVIGLDEAKDYENLPSIAQGFSRDFSIEALFAFWPLAFIIFGVWLLLKKCRRRTRYGSQIFVSYSWLNIILCIFAFSVGVLFSVNSFPFVPQKYDQYNGNLGVGPYQELIDYVNSKGGLTFWAHPEVEQKISGFTFTLRNNIIDIELYTPPYQEDLLYAKNYTGFAIFYEGMKYIGKPEGIWDKILVEYCNGVREKPVWAIGEVDFEGGGFPDEEIKHTQTFFLPKGKSREAVLEALSKGRMYAARAVNNELYLTEFYIANSVGDKVLMGEELACSTSPKIKISTLDKRLKNRYIKIELIRMGKIIQTFNVDGTADIEYTDSYHPTGEKIYYRLIISEGGFSKIVSNPIFVQFSK